MKNNSGILIAIILLSGLTGCAKQEADKSKTLEFSIVSGQKVYILEDTAKEYDRDNDLAFRSSASVCMPEVLLGQDVTLLRERIMAVAFDTVCPTPAEAMEICFAKAAEEMGYPIEAAPDSLQIDYSDGFYGIQGDILNITSRWLTYLITTSTYYPGAAHGMYNNSYVTYDLENGRIMTLDTLFTPSGLQELPALISRRAKKLEFQLGDTSINSLPAGGDFYINLEYEIVFVYQPYEVASYAQGIIQVPFYAYELTDYMTPEGLAFFGLNN